MKLSTLLLGSLLGLIFIVGLGLVNWRLLLVIMVFGSGWLVYLFYTAPYRPDLDPEWWYYQQQQPGSDDSGH